MYKPWCSVGEMETTERKLWVDGDEIYGIVLNCHNGYENRGARQFEKAHFAHLKLGSAGDCHVRDACMASCHALIEMRDKEVIVRVVDSAKGVLKNKQRVYGEGKVLDGDELELGDFKIKLSMMRPPLSPRTMIEQAPGSMAAPPLPTIEPYRHKETMLSLIEEFRRHYPGNAEIDKIEQLVHYDNGPDRDKRHRNMLVQLTEAVRSAREYAASQAEATSESIVEISRQLEKDAENGFDEEHEKKIEEMSERMMSSFDGLSEDELIAECLRLTARLSTAGNMTESFISMLETEVDDEEAPVIKKLLTVHQENSDRDLAALSAAISTIANQKEEE